MPLKSGMAAAVVKKPLPINPHVLAWARDWAGLSEEEAAKKAGTKSVDRVKEWESPESKRSPTVKQARKLAKAYGRSFLEFFLPAPPEIADVDLIPDFRLYRSREENAIELKKAQRWAEIQRLNTMGLYDEIDESPVEFPRSLYMALNKSAEDAADLAREVLNFRTPNHLRGNDRDKIVGILRGMLEQNGVLVLKHTPITKVGVRGFCLSYDILPVVVFGSESPRAQAFTIMHEFAHLMLNLSGISGHIPRVGGDASIRDIENWCNLFASSFLMPRGEIKQTFFPNFEHPLQSIEDEKLKEISNYFCVSEHALLVRLVQLKMVIPSFYWDVKKPEYDAHVYTSFGRAKFYGNRYVGYQGRLYTNLVLQAWGSGKITSDKAAEYMGNIKNSHLNDIKREYNP